MNEKQTKEQVEKLNALQSKELPEKIKKSVQEKLKGIQKPFNK